MSQPTIDDIRAAHLAAVKLRQAETDALIDRGLALAAAIDATDTDAPGYQALRQEYPAGRADPVTLTRQQWVDLAREQWQEAGQVEIDDNARTSPSEGGAYVQAWVWVDSPA